jgi:hypothetical protein
MPIQALADHCQSAEDVLRAAEAAVRRRKASYTLPPPEKKHSEIKIFRTKRTVSFEVLVRAAYPARYPDMPVFPDADISVYRPSILEIQKAVCRAFGVTVGDILSSRRGAPVVLPRQIAMALARRLTLRSFPEIGRQFGGKDHTTIIHSVCKMEPVMDRVEAEVEPGAALSVWVECARKWAIRIKIAVPRTYTAKVVEISS